MILFLTCILVPASTILFAMGGDLFSTNLSVLGSEMPGRLYFFLWAAVTGLIFRSLLKRIIGQVSPYLSASRELYLTDVALVLLMLSVLCPYRPEKSPMLADLHLFLAFSSSGLYFLILLSLSLKLYFRDPKTFAAPTASLLYSVFAAAAIFYTADYIITTLLEISVTIFSSFLLFYLWKKTSLQTEQRVQNPAAQGGS